MGKSKDLETKIDLMFGVLANEFLGKQAIQLFQSVQENMDAEDADKDALQDVLKKAMESYKHHSESVNDAISYYYDLFGEDSNANIIALIKERGLQQVEDPEVTSPVAEVKTASGNKSTKV